jgi:hypothetical protein
MPFVQAHSHEFLRLPLNFKPVMTRDPATTEQAHAYALEPLSLVDDVPRRACRPSGSTAGKQSRLYTN